MKHSLVVVPALVLALAVSTAAAGEPIERRLYPDTVEASSFLWGDWNRFIENYHPNYVGDDDPTTAWVEGNANSGAGEWLRIQVTPLDGTTRVRLKVRNGYQKSSALFAANARAKDVVVRLLPSKREVTATLTDTEGWQELTIAQPVGPMQAVELKVSTVYEGGKYTDLCLSDVAVFATATDADNPSFEKSKKKALLAWRAQRIAAAKVFGGGKEWLPMHPSYQVTTTERHVPCLADCGLDGMLDEAAADPDFKEWKAVIEIAQTAIAELDTLPQVRVAPRARTALPISDGFERPVLAQLAVDGDSELGARVLRLPIATAVAFLNATELKVLDVKRTRTPSQFLLTQDRRCKRDVMWAKRVPASDPAQPAQVRVLVIGTCGLLEGRVSDWLATALQVVVYGTDGRVALVVSDGAIDAYRWSTSGDRPMVIGGHALLARGHELDAVMIKP